MNAKMRKKTYHTSPIAAAEMPISIRSFAGAVCAALITAIAGPADISGLEFRECGGVHRDGGGDESGDDGCELHCVEKRGVDCC